MGAASRVVLQPEAVVLDVSGVLLRDLIHVQDLAGCLFHFPHLVHEVPESGPGEHLVGRKELHAVSAGVGVRCSGGLATDNLKQFHLQWKRTKNEAEFKKQTNN